MPVIFKQYGPITEITEIQKTPSKVRVHSTRKKRVVFRQRRFDNIRRTKQICVRRMLSAIAKFGCPLLISLTFTGDASDASFANDSIRVFQVRLRAKYPQAESIFIPELSPKGRIHFHGVIFNVPMCLGDTCIGRRIIAHGDERKTRILAKLWGEGYVDARKTDGNIRLAYYISKYINKGGGEVMFNAMRILRISHGIPKELIIRGRVAVKLQKRYANKKPIKKWEGDNPFLGKITKKTYDNTIL